MIFSRNKGGNYVKNFVNPTNPSTPLQVNVRQIRSQTSKAWAGLGQDTKNSWNNFAAENPVNNRLGDPIFLSGFGWYQKAAFNFVNIGGTLVEIRTPVLQEIPELFIDSFTCDLLTGILVTLSEAVPGDMAVIVRAKLLNTRGVANAGRLQQVKVVQPAEPPEIDITVALTNLFGSLLVDQVVFVEALYVQTVSGGAGPVAKFDKCVITDTSP